MDIERVRVIADCRETSAGEKRYRVRWLDPETGGWHSRTTGSSKKHNDAIAADLRTKLEKGLRTGLKSITWADFVDEHIDRIVGDEDRKIAKLVLRQFTELVNPKSPKLVKYRHVEQFAGHERSKGNKIRTVNKKLAYLRAAFNCAIRREYITCNPMENWNWTKADQQAIRVITEAEERALLDAAERLYGFHWRTCILFVLNTGCRQSELEMLRWEQVDLESDRPSIHLTKTKGKRDRRVYIPRTMVNAMRQLKMQTLKDGGPFVGLGSYGKRRHQWERIIESAGLAIGRLRVRVHDLRRTYVTRLIRAGTPVPTVQKLAGHRNVTTTMAYYNEVNDADLRDGAERLEKRYA